MLCLCVLFALCFNCICVEDVVIEFILCMPKDLSIELGSQILLFVVFNIIIVIIIFLGSSYVTNKEICLVRILFIYVQSAVSFVRSATD